MKFFILLSGVFALAQCVPVDNEDTVARLLVGNFVNCMNSDMSLCLKEHALKATERLRTLRALKLTDNLSFINNVNAKEGRSLEPLSTEPEARKQQISQRLWDTTSEILRNSQLEYTVSDDEEEASTSIAEVEEGRGKKKQKKQKLKMLIPLLIIAKIKAALLALGFLGLIAVSIWKLAFLAKIAFIVKIIALIKSLLQKKHMQDDHGWAAIQHHDDHSHGGGGWDSGASSGWSRQSRNDALSMAYAAQQK